MEKLLLLLAFPLAWPFVAKRIWDRDINWTEVFVNIVVICVLCSGVWYAGKFGQMADTEIWNGYVTAKDREHGHYRRSYNCRCKESCSGSGNNRSCSTTCDTCYEDHYTVTWTANTTVGDVEFDKKDSTWRSVYDSPDPSVYTRCTVGEPASRPHLYINYVQAVPQSLYNSAVNTTFAGRIPTYPSVYDLYRINRVLNVGTNVPQETTQQINDGLNQALKALGHKKQVNVIVILTSINDPSYRYAVENAWIGGKKNDVVVFVGLDGTNILWTDVMTWALNKGNELFHVKMRDALLDLKVLDSTTFVPVVVSTIENHFDRPEMKQFEYLAEEIEPPTWVIVIAVVIAIGGSIGLSIFFRDNEIEDVIGGLFGR